MENIDWKLLLSPFLSFVGVIIGAFLAFLSSSFLKKKETRLKISEKILDKKIEAHENVLELAKLLRSTLSVNAFTVEKELITYPLILHNKENYIDWKSHLYAKGNKNSHWLSESTHKELFFIQDYFVNLDNTLENVPDENMKMVAIILRNDIINLSTNLEKSIIEYFDNGWKDLRITSKKKKFKYDSKIALNRLKNYNYSKRHLEISKYFYEKKTTFPATDIKPITILFDVAPNGLKVNIIKIKEIPNLDNSGVEYELFFKDFEYDEHFIRFGTCDLISSKIRFQNEKIIDIPNEVLILLNSWIEENQELSY